ncbi:MAG: GNAT family N-acetyltransferase [Xanthomonadales bacterium]|nr:GNAT family N-acetyltransferase [Xanthomonadales bacterium]
MKIKTARLILRPFQPQDAQALFELNSDPDVMRYTGDRPFVDAAEASDFINQYRETEDPGFGRMAVTNAQDGEFMGFCGLKRDAKTREIDLGFRFFRRHWAKGIATEAAAASLDAGFSRLGLSEITGRAMRENLASITVLQKLGMRFKEISESAGLIWLVYSISAQEYSGQSRPDRDPRAR